ncbi:MAG: hypothetical protein FD180_620 [Planctomycetota bacterium]|nr:MAG: hypothetical protein FD180_620 [Planctomycetota bacterium]
MRFLSCLLASALAAFADDAATLKWISEEHGKLLMAARNDGLMEEAYGEVSMEMRASVWASPKTKSASGAGRIWITHWDDTLHRKYLAFAEKRKKMRTAAAAKFVAIGNEVKAAGDAEKAALAWRMALRYDAASREAHERLGEVLVDKQGWYPKEEAEKRKKGLLPVGNDWVPAKEAAARHLKWAEPWVVAGEHFEVSSNHSLDGANNVLARAEEMYHALTRELSEPGAAPAAPETGGLMKIYYFASRADLDEHDRTAHGDRPGLKTAPGFFSNEDKISHFFPLPTNALNSLEDVVRHEGAHQVAYWIWTAAGAPPTLPHFWAWEGFATYFESVELKDGKVLVGSPDHLRVRQFRTDFASGKHVPLAEFVTLDQRGVSGKYPQCAALANFFMNAGDGKHREKFVAYLKVVHEAQARADTFESAFGKKPADFQAEWEAWVRGLK